MRNEPNFCSELFCRITNFLYTIECGMWSFWCAKTANKRAIYLNRLLAQVHIPRMVSSFYDIPARFQPSKHKKSDQQIILKSYFEPTRRRRRGNLYLQSRICTHKIYQSRILEKYEMCIKFLWEAIRRISLLLSVCCLREKEI